MRRLWNSFYLLVLLSVVTWASTASVVTYLVHQGLRSQEVLLGRVLFEVLTLGVCTLALPGSRKALATYRWSHAGAIALCGALAVFLHPLLFFTAIGIDPNDTPSFVVINYMWPLVTMVGGVLILKERLSWHVVAGGLIGFAGYLVIQAGRTGLEQILRSVDWACILVFGAALSWGLFGAVGRRLSDRHRFEAISGMWMFSLAGLAMALPVCLVWGCRWTMFSRWDYVALMFLCGGMANGLCDVFWLRAIQLGGAGRASLLAYLTPIFSLGFLGFFMGQWPRWYAAFGILLIVGSIVLVELRRRRLSTPPGPAPQGPLIE